MYTLKQRISFLLVLLFCMLTSGVEYLPQLQQSSTTSTELSQNDSDKDGEQTFLSVSVNAVVPFAVAISQHVLHVIFEFVFTEKSKVSTVVSTIAQNFHFREILLERIISTNAP